MYYPALPLTWRTWPHATMPSHERLTRARNNTAACLPPKNINNNNNNNNAVLTLRQSIALSETPPCKHPMVSSAQGEAGHASDDGYGEPLGGRGTHGGMASGRTSVTVKEEKRATDQGYACVAWGARSND